MSKFSTIKSEVKRLLDAPVPATPPEVDWQFSREPKPPAELMHKPTVILKEKPRSVTVKGKPRGPKVVLSLWHGYKISRGYRRVTVWTFDAKTHERHGVDTCTPLSGATRETRILTIARFLRNNFNITLG